MFMCVPMGGGAFSGQSALGGSGVDPRVGLGSDEVERFAKTRFGCGGVGCWIFDFELLISDRGKGGESCLKRKLGQDLLFDVVRIFQ